MGDYAGIDSFGNNIYLFEETDVVQGGPDGIDNKPLKQLADRSIWLFNRVGKATNLSGEEVITANKTINKDYAGKLITAAAGVNTILNITLDDVSTFPDYAMIPVSSFCLYQGVVNINASAGQYFYDADGNRQTMYMHNKEHLFLLACIDHWKVLNASGNFYTAGEEVKSRKVLSNTVAPMGQELKRTAYPRLWEFVQTLTFGREVVSEAVWFSDIKYSGLYTIGDGATTFRLPDERSTTDRMLDLGRGLDYDRQHNFAGGYEADSFKLHTHNAEKVSPTGWPSKSGDRAANQYWISPERDPANARAIQIQAEGGTETRGKNIGKFNLIKY